MWKSKNIYLISILIFLICNVLGAQGLQEKKSLKKVINTFEKQHNYTFNYLEETISTVKIIPPSDTLSIEETINYLQEKSGLIFNRLGDKIITITKKDDLVLCGFLKDKDTQEPIVSATIQSLTKSTVSDENGFFMLPVSNENEIINIRFLGYKTISRVYKYFHTSDCVPIYLVLQEESLDQVILSNYLVEGINKLDTGEFEIDFNKFTILPGIIEADVLKAVQSFPGIQSVNETVSNINIRGGSHDQNLILWDEIKMYQSGHFFGLISAFNPSITSHVSLKLNGTSSEFSDGVSGTIAMKTEEGVNSTFGGNIGINLIDANAFVNIPIGSKSSIELAGRKSINNIFSSPIYEDYFNRISQGTEVENNEAEVINTNQDFNFYDISFRWLYKPSEKDIIRINFININNELVFNENVVFEGEVKSKQSSVAQSSIGGGLFYQRDWSDRFKTSLQIYETDYKLKAINANLLESQRFLQENIVSETGAKISSSFKINNSFIWQLGYQFIETEVTNLDDVDVPLIRTLISEVVRSHNGFTQLKYSNKNRSTNINVGFRYTYLEKFNKNLFEPRLSFSQRFLQNFSFELAGEFKHQITSQVINFQNDFLGVEKRRWQLSNDEDIPVLTSKQVSFALNYTQKGFLVSADAYFKSVDGITTQSQGFQNQYEFVKTDGYYEVVGIDFLFRKRFRNVNVWLSYSIMDNQYFFKSLPEENFPSNLDISQSATFGITYRYKNLKLASGVNWHTGKPTTRPDTEDPIVNDEINYQPTNSDNLKYYMRVDFSALYQFKIASLDFQSGISIWNLLNQENEINNYYRIDSNGAVNESVENALEITPNVFLKFLF